MISAASKMFFALVWWLYREIFTCSIFVYETRCVFSRWFHYSFAAFVVFVFFCFTLQFSIGVIRRTVFFFNAFPRHSVVRQVIEIYFSSCALPSSSFSSHFNCYYCHGGFKWHAKMQATTKTTRSLLLHQKVSYFARYRHVVIRLAFPSFVIPAIFIYHCLKAVIKHILHHNYFFSLHFKQFHKLFVVGFFSSSVRSLCKWRMGGVCLCNIAIKMVTC